MSQTDRTLINQANAQKSTGPRTPEGKQRSCMNAFKHNLSGQHLVLVEHEYDAYSAACERGLRDLKPMTEPERQIAQKIIDINFRLNRITAVETNMYNLDTMSLVAPYLDDADAAESASSSDRQVAIDDRVEIMAAQTRAWKTDAHTFDILGRYEARLFRQLLGYQKELERLQAMRKAEEAAADEPALALFDNIAPRAAAAAFATSVEPSQMAAVNPQMASFGISVPSPPQPGGSTLGTARQPLPPPARLRVPDVTKRPAA